MKTIETEEYRRAIHLSKLIPLGKKTQEKKDAVHNLFLALKEMLKVNS
jgi:hypothetical protein